jgi:hypothetical protein
MMDRNMRRRKNVNLCWEFLEGLLGAREGEGRNKGVGSNGRG